MATMPAPWHWRHAGEYKLINADGSLNPHPNTFNRLPSLGRQTLWLGELLSEGVASGFPRPLFKLLRQVLGDHTPQAYIDRLHALEISR